MANPLEAAKDFTHGQLAALVHKIGGPDIAWAILHDEKLVQVVDPPPKFVVGDLFVSAEQQLANARRWNTEYKLGFTDEAFERFVLPPAAGNGFVRLVLVPYLDALEETFERWWKIAAAQQPDKYRWSEVKSDSDHLRLLEGIKHPGKCLRWEVIDLAANWDKKNGIRPKDVRNPKTSPHAGILVAAAHFPKWVQAMDGKTVPYAWLPGYELNVPGYGVWAHVPNLYWNADDRQVGLGAHYAGHRTRDWAVPSLRE